MIQDIYPFTEFNLVIREEIYNIFGVKKVMRRKESPVNFKGWNVIGEPIPDKHFAVTKFKFRRDIPHKLLHILYKKNRLQFLL